MKNLMSKQLVLTAFAVFALYSCGNGGETNETVTVNHNESVDNSHSKGQADAMDDVSAKNILQIAIGSKDHTTLVAGVQAAGIEHVIVNAGPLTVFAPVNTAFDKLPEGTVETLLKPENKEKLAFILVNHVAPANYPIKQLKKEAKKGRKLYMASGKYLVVENKDGKIFVGGTEVLKSVKVSNGWIHVVGDVLVPSEDK
jgi:uncharacterized surface protein with fasciclin (FAS1) repeats